MLFKYCSDDCEKCDLQIFSWYRKILENEDKIISFKWNETGSVLKDTDKIIIYKYKGDKKIFLIYCIVQ